MVADIERPPFSKSLDPPLADVFENFQNMFIEIYELDLARFLSAP